jgi:hypothetical protein
MTDLDRNHLAAAYMAAWFAAKGSRCEVEPAPHGWYVIKHRHHPLPRRVRATVIIKGLAVLAGRLEQDRKQATAQPVLAAPAPVLLNALQKLVRAIDRLPGNNPLDGLADEARAAIAQATGQ